MWIRRFIVFHKKRHPSEMGEVEVSALLSWLASARRVSASTQNQALSALLFLYREVLRKDLDPIEHVPRAKVPVRVPVVLTPDEVRSVLRHLTGVPWLVKRIFLCLIKSPLIKSQLSPRSLSARSATRGRLDRSLLCK